MPVEYENYIYAMYDRLSSIIYYNAQFTNELDTARSKVAQSKVAQHVSFGNSENPSIYSTVKYAAPPNISMRISDLALGARYPMFFSDDSDVEIATENTNEQYAYARDFYSVATRSRVSSARTTQYEHGYELRRAGSTNRDLIHLDDAIAIIRSVAQYFATGVGLLKGELRPAFAPSINPQVALRNFTSSCLDRVFRKLRENVYNTTYKLLASNSENALKICKADVARYYLAGSQQQQRELRKENLIMRERIEIYEFYIYKLVTRLETLTQQTIDSRKSLVNHGAYTGIYSSKYTADSKINVTSQEQILLQEDAIQIMTHALCQVHAVASNKVNTFRPEQARHEYIKIIRYAKPGIAKALEVLYRTQASHQRLNELERLLDQL